MAGLTGILDMAKRAMMTQQVAINVTSHNVSNASTPGYSRQRLNMVAAEPLKESFGLLGTGVEASSVQRLRTAYIDQQIRGTNANIGTATQQEQILGQVEAAFNEPSDSGLGSMISNFFNAFEDLSTHPEESSSRSAVLQSASAMTDTFHRLSSGLLQLKSDLVPEVQSRVDQVNQLVKDIWQTDQNITAMKASGVDANDAMDQRDSDIEALSKLVDAHVSQDAQGASTIAVGGVLLESRAGYSELTTDNSSGTLQIVTKDFSTPVQLSSGELGGILTTYDTTIPGYLSKLDTLANAITTQVNTVHATGYGLGTPPPTGNDFFNGTTAQSIDLSAAVTSNANNIAASAGGAPGDNATALAIAGIANQQTLDGGSASILQYYNGIVSDIGFDIQSKTNTESSQNLVLNQLQSQRDSVSGVSIDEEMVNLIKFQKGFDAAAKVITTVNDMYQSILNMV